ncbi:hypothetical protein K402DRAFT_340910 [Aulographum hederae CBS 113979]|uniref:Uncharacterized protein n=1 Tax=Aulographum hederae CBS 113979 TaxID=1176131 RepID=A0A6G1GMM0_9PEZI|nr:hypothetical protein K402DRAFT_340910 [Aulographum hederae CBS 113979]
MLPACAFLLLAHQALANTEKTIFRAPPSVPIPNIHPGLDDLCLHTLSPAQSSLRTTLQVYFPTDEQPRGEQSWYLLEGLKEGRRYEVRVCWLATQPTNFWLDTYPITTVFETPELITPLAIYSHSRTGSGCPNPDRTGNQGAADYNSSLLFLHIHSAADFFTTDKSLMNDPPSVSVDIILDPYILNIFPQSLVPTAIYITVVAVLGVYLSGLLWSWLVSVTGQRKLHSD